MWRRNKVQYRECGTWNGAGELKGREPVTIPSFVALFLITVARARARARAVPARLLPIPSFPLVDIDIPESLHN